MAEVTDLDGRRPRVDDIFQFLYDEIVSLRLRPGDKISEADIAARFGVSRQPVRDAFYRLGNLDLLLIRPQRATEVKRFSTLAIQRSRFVRAAVEKEVLQRAAAECDEQGAELLDACLARQDDAIKRKDHAAFTNLDYEFHEALCEIGKVSFAFDVISSEKANVDRLCMLALSKEHRMPLLVDDHKSIAACVKAGDAEGAVANGVLHLSRLDSTIEGIYENHAHYFEPVDARSLPELTSPIREH